LHPWFKPATLKRKRSAMFPRLESPSPVDGDDFGSRVKRQRQIILGQTPSKKRKLPSPPQSPIEEPDDPLLFKRQRCTTLERSIERLSLTPLTQVAAQAPAHELAGPLPLRCCPLLIFPSLNGLRWARQRLPLLIHHRRRRRRLHSTRTRSTLPRAHLRPHSWQTPKR